MFGLYQAILAQDRSFPITPIDHRLVPIDPLMYAKAMAEIAEAGAERKKQAEADRIWRLVCLAAESSK